MAALVSHAMHRFPTSPPDAVPSSYGIRSESGSRHGGDVTPSGSTGALSRSMRYAEPWLYGTVRASSGLLLTPALVLCQCPEYLSGSKRNSSKKSPTLCKKCKGTRFPMSPGDSKFGTVRCYPTSQQIVTSTPLRAGTVRVTSSSRPSILPTTDPYDLMRRSRLSVSDITSSVSPFRDKVKSPKKNSNNHSFQGRRSILECNINPYELMSGEKLGDSKKSQSNEKRKNKQRDYEDVHVPKNAKPKKKSPVRLISTPITSDKESDQYNTLTSSRFKSILKKRSSNYNSDSYSDVEEVVSPASPRKTATKFYVPVTIPLTPRKKVQFVDAGDEDDLKVEQPLKEDSAEEIFEDALEEVPQISNVELVKTPKQPVKITRSNSDCVNGAHPSVSFYDTMALRTRKRSDSRILIADKDLAKLDGVGPRSRKVSPPKPTSPPPPPPTEDKNQEYNTNFNMTNIGTVENEKKDVEVIPEIVEPVVEEPTPPEAPPRKRSGSKQPIVNVVTVAEPPQNVNKTIVEIKPPPTVHKIKIKNEFPEYTDLNTQNVIVFDNPQRKTSILINGDDCYSTVINDNIPLYQSSVVVNDESSQVQICTTNNSSKIYITPANTSIDREPDSLCPTEITHQITLESLTITPASPASPDITELLRDPVEAVRHNLVPHVCGKSDVARRQRDLKFPKHTTPLAKTESLLESPLEEANIPSSVEDSFMRLKNYEASEDAEFEDESQYELMDQGSECYTDHSNRSSVTEEELANRTKFYELLAESGNIEVSEGEDHHYESIKVNNNDPIYEEIELPPPLPSNPPPASILDDLQLDKEYTTRSIFEGASKYDILSYLVDAKERGIVQEEGYTYHYPANHNQDDDTKEPYNRVSQMSTVSDSSEDNSLIISGALIDEKAIFQKPAEIERNDSGVGSETSKSSLSKYRTKPEILVICEDCESPLDSKTDNEPLLCRKCVKKRSERKEIITEIVETEEKYSRDLQIILEEFYQPMLVAGLLTPDQLSAIFLNTEELVENSQALAERLRDAVEIALEQGDDDLLTVNIGKLFLEAAPMLHAFETYCVRQGNASLLLASLEKEKELLRIFLRVSQMENTLLRRMNLNSFLMVPVQRVTKYPLLLARLYKVTPPHHETREQLKDAQHKIELHLNHMNSETKDVPSKLWRRIGSNNGRRSSAEMDLVNIKLRKIAVDVLEWNHDEARFILEGKLLFTQPTDNNWRKGRTIKLTPVNALLVINGKMTPNKPPGDKTEDNCLIFSAKNSRVREAALLLVRDKNGRYSLLREPLYLDRCVIAADPAWQSYFEVQELLNKDTFIFKAEDEAQTHMWYRKLQYHAQGMGAWRKRRNALANIMINGMGLRS